MRLAVKLNPKFGYAFKRIDRAFKDYAPNGVVWVNPNDNPDATIIHAVGGEEVADIESATNPIIVQHCYFTTHFREIDWPKYWENSLLTISFHNLPEYTSKKFNFIRTPWGADTRLFYRDNFQLRPHKVFVTGHVAETEGIDKIFQAVSKLNLRMLHTGSNFNYDPRYYTYLNYMSDNVFRTTLNNVEYVAGLRYIEGFEMACVEGLFCGARPIVFDLPTYDFYKNFGVMLNPTFDLREQLMAVFSSPAKPVTDEDMKNALQLFDWKNIMHNIYDKIFEAVC